MGSYIRSSAPSKVQGDFVELYKTPKSFRISKAVFLVLNIVFFFLGVAVIAVGLYFKVGKEEYFKLFRQFEFDVAVALILAAGVLAIVTAAIGLAGILWKFNVVLILYFLLVIMILSIEVAAGALALTNKSKVEREVEERLLVSMNNKKLITNWHKLHKEQDCCGVLSYQDWKTVDGYGAFSIPSSCCRRSTKSCGRDIDNINQKGCLTKMKDFLSRSDTIQMIGAAGVTVGLLQIILAITVVILIVQLRHYRKSKAQFLFAAQNL